MSVGEHSNLRARADAVVVLLAQHVIRMAGVVVRDSGSNILASAIATESEMENLLHQGFAAGLSADSTNEDEAIPGRDLFTIAKYLIPTDAHLVCGCLVAAGVPAVVADDNHVQANLLISPALGGVRILVPEAFLQQGYDVLNAFERGDFQLRDDADVGSLDTETCPKSKA